MFQLCNEDIELKAEAVAIAIATCNELGLVWSTREDGISKYVTHNVTIIFL